MNVHDLGSHATGSRPTLSFTIGAIHVYRLMNHLDPSPISRAKATLKRVVEKEDFEFLVEFPRQYS